jgi:hypothetical protein
MIRAIQIKKALATHWQLGLIVLLALSLRVWGITFGLPGIDHGDEAEVVNHAVRFGIGDLNPHRFVYGSLFQYILFFFYGMYFVFGYLTNTFSSVHEFALYFAQDPAIFHLIARSLSAILGTATVILAYRAGKHINDHTTGLLSALFLAVAYEHVVHSHYGTVDIALSFFFALAVYRCLLLYEHGRWQDYIWAGVCVGLAFGVKFNGIFAVIPLVLAHLFRNHAGIHQRIFSPRLAGAAGCIFLGHIMACPFFYVEIPLVLREVTQMRDLHGASTFTLIPYLQGLSSGFWGIPLGGLCLLGLLEGVVKNKKKLLIVITIIAILFFASLHRYVEAKYILHVFPLLAVCAATLLVRLLKKKNTFIVYLVACIVSMHSLYHVCCWDYEHTRTSINLMAKQWIEQNLPVNAKILVDNVGNEGPKLENSPENFRRQYEKAAGHNLMKADYLKLKSELKPAVYYDISLVDCSAGSIADDYEQYRTWEDLEKTGLPASYYREKGFQYIIMTDRYNTHMGEGFLLLKEFKRHAKTIHVYAVPP